MDFRDNWLMIKWGNNKIISREVGFFCSESLLVKLSGVWGQEFGSELADLLFGCEWYISNLVLDD